MSGGAAGPGALAATLRRELRTGGRVRPGDDVAVALSGGLDSVVLLHLLRFPLADLGLRLFAAHVDHAMRPGSAADAAWVRGLCRAWGVPLREARLATAPRSENDARSARYRALARLAPAPARILTAHHADDQAETLLFRLARGTGPRGLRGIAPARGRLVRPLLPVPRGDLTAYAAAHGIAWREDPTNRELRYARNRLRHRVLPALEALRPGATARIAALALDVRREEAAWDAALEALEGALVLDRDEDALVLARPVLQTYHPHLRARVMRRFLRRYGTTPDRAGTHAALEFISSGPSGGEIHLPGGVRLERDFDRVRITRAGAPSGERAVEIPGEGNGSATALIGGRSWHIEWGAGAGEAGEVRGRGGGGDERVVLQSPAFPLRVRGWRPGDRIRLGYGRKKLKKLFVERRLDRDTRRRTPVVVDARGRVLWVVGLARAEGVEGSGGGFQIAVRDAG